MALGINLSKPYTQTWLKQSGNLFVADLAGTAMEAVTVANIHRLERAFPQVTQPIINALDTPVQYFQKPIEWTLGHTKNFEGEENYQNRLKKTPEERVKSYSSALFRYGSALGMGWATTIGTERFILSKITHTPRVPMKIYSMDGAMHLGLIALMSTPILAPATEKAKQVIRAISSTLGADDEQSEDIARLAIATGIPNYTVFGVVSHKLYKHNKLEALGKELGVTSSLSRSM